MINNAFRIVTVFVTFWGMLSPATSQSIDFIDMSGDKVHLSAPAKRIVVIPIPAASMLVGMDESSEKLVGMHPFAKVAAREGMLGQMFSPVLQVNSNVVGNSFTPNIEALLNVEPDLVWQWGHRGDDIISPMRNAGLTVATLDYGQESYTQEWVRLMGQTLGHNEKAQKMIEWRQHVIALLSSTTAKIPESEQPRVCSLSHCKQSLQSVGSTSHNNADFALAGGVSLNRDLTGPRTLNIEQILVWNPDIILLGNFEEGLSPEDVYQNPMLSEVTAVKNQRVYKLPIGGFIWDAPNQETPLYWQWLAMIFHPETVKVPIREEIRQRYQQLYGYNVSEQQIDGILQMGMNKKSLHYLSLMGKPDA
ncbi:ABC transporter substrate-binding protein [Providencia huashanensis]|uniref:ABC transporter substrate-binding protein n=1 Tax=Providencia huashanensis TaxID=3037798 RepID=UPI002AFFD695|nr:ABC transporter substrate-binding protein [Providencia sp. 3007]